jgi:hypothetical protein
LVNEDEASLGVDDTADALVRAKLFNNVLPPDKRATASLSADSASSDVMSAFFARLNCETILEPSDEANSSCLTNKESPDA